YIQMDSLKQSEKNVLEQLQISSYNENYGEVIDDIIADGFDINPIYSVKEIANLLDTSEHTIRYYDKVNMFPFVTRDSGNRRVFSKLDAFLGRSINCFRSVDFTLEECREFNVLTLKGDSTIPARADMLRNQQHKPEEQLKDIQIKLQKVGYKLEYFESLEDEVLQEIKTGTFVNKGRSSLKNCRLFIQKKFFEAGLVDSIEIDI
ncbi:MAG: MerR family transcriptional regulator, partial [Clostridiales bacterium]|nr:MerR family transcriptional regulator [Clostridiales bacterium]